MITGLHAMLFAADPEAARAFVRDVLGWDSVDAGGGWLIFGSGPSELGVHPAAGGDEARGETHHEVSLVCDDIEQTVAELSARGAEFAGPVEDRGFGLVARLVVPGAGELLLYQPAYPPAFKL